MPGELKVLTTRHLAELRELVGRDPVAHCFVAARLADPMDPWSLGGQVWGWFEGGRLRSALYTGANLIPVETTPLARVNLADHARRLGRRCSSIVGPAEEVLDLWRLLGPAWGPARELRPTQHLMAIATAPTVEPHPGLRPVRPDEIDLLMPAAVAMFTEEVGVSPVEHGGGASYRSRLAELIRTGRALAVVEEGRIVFKAEIGSATHEVCQVQGVWVEPGLRGRGLGTIGMAAVVAHARAHVAPVVSLYVNDFNHPAVLIYERVGFSTVGTFATVLF
ncbi:MAG: GNAT family N-acetyltransferase [Candidatus Nanopelagicales bacterium]|nr:GNAT family N-acetyltransferase [Candidatus Nanopelagicales bacterium]